MTTTPKETDWKEKAEAAFKAFLNSVEEELPLEAGVVEIEVTLAKHYQAMMSETLQALADREPFPPKQAKRDT